MHEIHRSMNPVKTEFEKDFFQSSTAPVRSGLPLHLAVAMSLLGLVFLVSISSYAGGPQKGSPATPPYKPAISPGESDVLDPPDAANPPVAVPVKPKSRYAPGDNSIPVESVPAPVAKKPKPKPVPRRQSNPCDLDCSYCDSLCETPCGDCGSAGGGCGNTPEQKVQFGSSSPYFNAGVTYWNGVAYKSRSQVEYECKLLYGNNSQKCVEEHLLKKRSDGVEGHLGLRLDHSGLATKSYTGFSDTGRAGAEIGGRVDKKLSSVVLLQGDARAHWVGGSRSYTVLPSGDQVLNNEQGAKAEVLLALTMLNENACNIYLGVLARLNLVNDASRDKLNASRDIGTEGGLKCETADGRVKFLIGANLALSYGDQLYTQSDLEKKLGFRTYVDFLDRLRISGRTEYRYRSEVSESEFAAEFRNVGHGFYFRYSVEWQNAQQIGADTAVSAGPGTAEPVVHATNQVVVGFGF